MKRSPLRRYTPLSSRGMKWIRPKPIAKVSPKRNLGTPGGEYVFTYAGKDYSLPGRMIVDPKSPDGLRWIATPASYRQIHQIVRELADGFCEVRASQSCWKYVPPSASQTHHAVLKKMGGAHTDDRIWRDGERIRFLVCPSCHRKLHGQLAWSQPGWMGVA